jgi:NADPH-dependent ferric siderophore reductase
MTAPVAAPFRFFALHAVRTGWLGVPHTADRHELRTRADARIAWLPRGQCALCAADMLRAARLPQDARRALAS